ncbi:butyrate kinase [Bacilliculturomica massiliensis]|uniref:butyrate kinase n=1 Tax=Bacilliculturomica massiliensis TaxID=1917867 RepID=UPI001030BEA2|nr:butyrate kinase [Bacilliculturomica massiliensis]
MHKFLVINPGSTSTKLAVYEDDKAVFTENIVHDPESIGAFENIVDQLPFRLQVVQEFLKEKDIDLSSYSAIMCRGGMVPNLRTGGYRVNEELFYALGSDISSPHASNLGGMLGKLLGDPVGVPAYIYDAVTAGELQPVAKITGIPNITRQSCCHVLNSRAMAMRYADQIGKKYEDLNLIVAHLGGGVSVSVHSRGTIIDSMGDDDGQFSPERAGSVPCLELVDMCYSGYFTRADMKKKIRGRGGMYAHLGTSDCREIEKMIAGGDEHAALIFHAQAYQIAKGIGLLSIVNKGKNEAIILTGGVAFSKMMTDMITDYVSFIAPVVIMPGEHEMDALAQGGLRIVTGAEEAKTYHLPPMPKKNKPDWLPDLSQIYGK